ncbi:MAG: IclR family transcriptional regulator [Vibrio sp.]|uniref:IclR family transcriptional regulator n=1 Tax=Vibrio sp. TaxID=678 RepID=UPI003A8B3417
MTNETKSILKGMSVLECISIGAKTLKEIQEKLDIPKTTIHRTLKSLEQGNYVRDVKGIGYVLGTSVIRLGVLAQEQMPLKTIARPYLEALAKKTNDTVHLGIKEGDYIFYLDKVSGSRSIEMKSKIGDRLPMATTGIGKSLMLDFPKTEIDRLIDTYVRPSKNSLIKERMSDYCEKDYSFDIEDNDELLRCVAVPIRNRYGNIIAAISIASINIYMDESRMYRLIPIMQDTARLISSDIENL